MENDGEKIKLVIEINKEHYGIIMAKVCGIRIEQRKYGYADDDTVPLGWEEIADGKPYESKYVMKKGEE